jgi:hypothetical protein
LGIAAAWRQRLRVGRAGRLAVDVAGAFFLAGALAAEGDGLVGALAAAAAIELRALGGSNPPPYSRR